MPKIFISYRRADSQTFTDRIYDRLAAAFGESNVFQDVDSIRMGADFRMVLREAVESCDIVLVMIGSQWATVTDAQGRKRLFNTADFVRIEVESALNSQKVVIPVIIEGAAMPNSEDLPPSLHELLFRNAAKIRHNPDFNRDMQRLIDQIERHDEELAQQYAAEEAEQQRQSEIEAQAKAQAEALERKRLADEQARLKALADEQERQRRAEPEAATPQPPPAQTATSRPQPEPLQPTRLPEPEIYTPPAPLELIWRRVLNRTFRRLIAVAALIVLAIAALAIVSFILKFRVVGDFSTIGTAHNSDWTPIEQDVNGVSMVKVPAGCFVMGSTSGSDDELPLTRLCFEQEFWIDKTEVTNAQFAQFKGKMAVANSGTGANRPLENINWFEARDFCELRDGRLPTEAEWEYAARGPDNLTYPWGNDYVADNVVWYGNSNSSTVDVGSKPTGASWVGALDMSGSVWEWVSTLYQPYPYPTPGSSTELQEWINSDDTSHNRVWRVGSWYDYQKTGYLRAADRVEFVPEHRSNNLGFRCVVSTPLIVGITRNTDWTPIEQDVNGVSMVKVPSGCFIMGSAGGMSNELPLTRLCFEQDFWIDKTEVTNAQFAEFDGKAVNASNWTDANRPREKITWFEAGDFCILRGGRLPTEAAWEYAARGPDNLKYPWGNEFIADNVVYYGNSNNHTADVGSKTAGVSWVGALDMGGNVLEWVSTLYQSYPYPTPGSSTELQEWINSNDIGNSRVWRGGAYDMFYLDATFRHEASPLSWHYNLGFRCAVSTPIVPSLSTDTSPLAPTVETRTGVSQNANWKPVEQEFNGVTMVQVPAGCFDMGNDPEAYEFAAKGVGNGGHICFDTAFWLDKNEVTNAQFAQFNGKAANVSNWTDANRPRESITWFEARDFCALRGGRLPTEAEWEYATRGPDNLEYPWGNDFVADNVVYSGNSNNQTADVGSKAAGASWVGALDMSGNIWEWVSTLYQPYPYPTPGNSTELQQWMNSNDTSNNRVLRGGSWGYDSVNLRAAFRGGNLPLSRNYHLGFRCAVSTPIVPSLSTDTPLPVPTVGIARNADWTPVEQDVNGVTMVQVPAGCFDMGSTSGDSDELPLTGVCFEQEFWLDKTEVTNAQFAQFNGKAAESSNWTDPNRPRETIAWFEARDFCTLRGVRLPTEAEWEYAARGPDNLKYPWGNEFAADKVVYSENSNNQTADVGSKSAGVSWVGAVDMSGNVWEWVSTLYQPYPTPGSSTELEQWINSNDTTNIRSLRGGAWNDAAIAYLRAADRNLYSPSGTNNNVGFRCVVSAPIS